VSTTSIRTASSEMVTSTVAAAPGAGLHHIGERFLDNAVEGELEGGS
jgi:hypothetical protein